MAKAKQTYQVVDLVAGIEIISTDKRPDYLVSTDMEDIHIRISGEHSNAGMKKAIDAVTSWTNCGVLAIKEV